MRLASGCEPPIAAAYTALSPAAPVGPDARYWSRAHQAPAARIAPRSRRPGPRPGSLAVIGDGVIRSATTTRLLTGQERAESPQQA